MNGINAVLMLAAIISGANAVCNNATQAKTQECLFASSLLQSGGNLPVDEAKITAFCGSQKMDLPVCLNTQVTDCADDVTQSKLLALLVDVNKTKDGIQNLCSKADELTKSNCADGLGTSQFTTCLDDAVGVITDMEGSDMKYRLDTLCKFFSDWRSCFSTRLANCSAVADIYNQLYQGIEYPYCKLNEADKQARLDDIVSSAGPISLNLLSLLAVFLAYWLL